jgi:hypothetical protein
MFDRRRPKGRLFSLMVAVVTAIGLRGLSFGLPASSHHLASTGAMGATSAARDAAG